MVKNLQILLVVLFTLNISICPQVNSTEETSISVVPYEDTYISTENPTNTYCYDAELHVNKSEKTFLMFHIDEEIGVYDSVSLRLTPIVGSGSLSVCSLTSNDISLLNLKGNSQKTYGNAVTNIVLTGNQQSSADITDYAKEHIDMRGYIGFALIVSEDSDSSFVFPSRESGIDNAIYLDVKRNGNLPKETQPIEEAVVDDGDELVLDKGILVKKSELKANIVPPPALPQYQELKDYIDIDSLTTTRYKPWMVNYHLTEPVQIGINYKGGDAGQKCLSLTVAPSNPNRLLLGSDTEMIWRSEDGGVTWKSSTMGIGLSAIPSLIFHPDNDNIAYALSCSMKTTVSKDSMGIYKSEDGGKSWRQVAFVLNHYSKNMDCFAFGDADSKGKRNIYCISWLGGLYRSCDEGESWENMGLNEYNLRQIDVVGEKLIITSTKGLLVSNDGGKTFERKMNGIVNDDVRSVLIHPDDESNWFCLDSANLYESKDYGEDWEIINNFDGVNNGYGHASSVGGLLMDMKFSAPDESGNHILYVGLAYIHYIIRCSSDYGKTFAPTEIENNVGWLESNWGWSIEAIAPHPYNHNIMWTLLDDEIYKTTDGGKSLFPSSSGYSGHRVVDFWFNPEDPNDIMFACTDRGFTQTVPSGRGEQYPAMTNIASEDKYWIRFQNNKSIGAVTRDPKNPKRCFIAIGPWNVTIIKESTDGGLTWKAVSDDLVSTTVNFIAFNSNNYNTIYAGDFISYDDGKTWNKSDYRIKAMCPLNGNIVYSSTAQSILKSIDEGRTWKILYTGVGIGDKRIDCDIEKEDKLYLGTFLKGIQIYEDGKLRTINEKNGLSMGLFGCGYYQVAQDPHNPSHLVTCSNDALYNTRAPGVFESFDGGETWKNIEGMECQRDAWSVEWHPTLPRVYIGTSAGTYVYEYEKYYDMSEKYYLDTQQSYARDEIDKLFELKITDQFHDGYFRPKEPFTRGEIIAMVNNFIPIASTDTDQVFSDITIRSREFVSTRKAYDAGLIIKSDDGLFRPYDDITYEELLIIISRILSYCNVVSDIKLPMLNSVPNDLSEHAKYSYAVCSKLGIIDDNVNFSAATAVTHEDAAYMLYRLLDLI